MYHVKVFPEVSWWFITKIVNYTDVIIFKAPI